MIQQRFKGVGMRWSEAGSIICSISDWRGLTNDSIASSQIGCPPPTRRYARKPIVKIFGQSMGSEKDDEAIERFRADEHKEDTTDRFQDPIHALNEDTDLKKA